MSSFGGLLPGLRQRSRQAELMDGAGLQDPALQARVLADLAAVNRLTRTHAPVLRFLRRAWADAPRHTRLGIVDVGSGQGDLLRDIWRLAQRERRTLRLVGIDLHPDSGAAARAATPAGMPIEYLTGDVLDALDGPTDYVVSTQLAHHLDDAQLLAWLQHLDRQALRGWCIADLRRHWLPYLGFRWLARLAGWHAVVRIDGTRSIARALTEAEWHDLLRRAGVVATVQRHAPFRLSVQSLRPRPARAAGSAGSTQAGRAA